MPVEIQLSGNLLPGERRRMTVVLDHPAPVLQVIRMIGLDPDEVGLIVVNGVQSELEDTVPVDCRLSFFPPLSGG